MEIYTLTKDMHVLCVKADSFPNGIMSAFNKLKSLINDESRTLFGISRPENGTILYKAAALETYPGEANDLNCEPFVIEKGDYMSETITNWQQNESSIGTTFAELIKNPRIAPDGYCIEWYKGKDVQCMVRVKP